jgi:hypothetical protein
VTRNGEVVDGHLNVGEDQVWVAPQIAGSAAKGGSPELLQARFELVASARRAVSRIAVYSSHVAEGKSLIRRLVFHLRRSTRPVRQETAGRPETGNRCSGHGPTVGNRRAPAAVAHL